MQRCSFYASIVHDVVSNFQLQLNFKRFHKVKNECTIAQQAKINTGSEQSIHKCTARKPTA